MEECRIILRAKEDLRIRAGHPWVYNNEIARIDGAILSGEAVGVYDAKGLFVGRGFVNTASKIFVRILTRKEDQPLDRAFFKQILQNAAVAKQELGYTDTYRLLFAEADGIPGLIIDRYNDYLVLQVLSLGIDQRKAMFIDLLVELFHPVGIYERSDVSVRSKEGLQETVGVLYGQVPDCIVIQENGLSMQIDVKNGQKTGHFLDQQANHLALKPYVAGKTVLDCFSHTGGFGLHALAFNATAVSFVDMSESACRQIETNVALNHFQNATIVKADVFKLLRDYNQNNTHFDVVILDPPAFTKTADTVQNAYKGYKEINLQAMKLLSDGGYLVSCSCSNHMTPALFLEMLSDAAADSQRKVQMIEFRTQGKDHPTLFGSEETLYLKCVIMRISNPL